MLYVKTKIIPSPIHGIGLFADQFISKNTLIWKFQPPIDIRILPEEAQNLPQIVKETFLKYSYLSIFSKKYILCFDNAQFMNHSNNPNTKSSQLAVNKIENEDIEIEIIAAYDIYSEQEITCDYRSFDLMDFQNDNLYK